MDERDLRDINTSLREALYSACEALQTGEIGFAMACYKDSQRATLAAERATPEVRELVGNVVNVLEGGLRTKFVI